MIYPDKMDDELRWILGRPCFAVIHLSQLMREDGAQIATKAEAEQAQVIDWMVRHYLRHGHEKWRAAADAEVSAMMERVKAKRAGASGAQEVATDACAPQTTASRSTD